MCAFTHTQIVIVFYFFRIFHPLTDWRGGGPLFPIGGGLLCMHGVCVHRTTCCTVYSLLSLSLSLHPHALSDPFMGLLLWGHPGTKLRRKRFSNCTWEVHKRQRLDRIIVHVFNYGIHTAIITCTAAAPPFSNFI